MNTDILNHPDVERLISLSLDEDGIGKDLTTLACRRGVKGGRQVRATIVVKKGTVLSGGPLVARILKAAGVEASIKTSILLADGAFAKEKSPWMIFEGEATDLLRVERTILNFLMRMSGIAQYTAQAVERVKGTNAKILHTRKTAPGHRRTDIYAAICGGAHPHRRSLDDAILVKENHIRFAKSFQDLVDGVNHYRDQASFVEIEASDFTELKYSLLARPTRVMLDNFSIADTRKAVELYGSSLELESSGGITLENLREYAEAGVDYISMGALTHSAPAADLSLLFDI